MSAEYIPGQNPPVYSGGDSSHAAFDMLHTEDNHSVEPPTDLDTLNRAVGVDIALEQEHVAFHELSTQPGFQMKQAAHGAPGGVLLYVASGFNSPSGPPSAALMPLLRQYGDVAVPRLSNTAFTVDKYAELIIRIAAMRSAQVVVPVGLSMGGTQNIAIATRLKQEGLEVFPTMISSPLDRSDVKGAARNAVLGGLAFAHSYLRFQGGNRTRYLLETVGYAIDNIHKHPSIGQASRHALAKVRGNETPTNIECLSRAGWFWRYNPAADLALLKETDTPIGYTGPEDSTMDQVVNNDRAVSRLKASGIAIRRRTDPQVGHANPCDYPLEHQRMVGEIFSEFGLRSAEERGATIYI